MASKQQKPKQGRTPAKRHEDAVKGLELSERQAKVSDLLLQSKTYRQIAKAVGVKSTRTVHTDVQTVIAFWREKQLHSIDAWIALELERIGRVEAEAWEAWERSQQDAEIHTEKTTDDGTETTETVKGQVGDGRFLDIVLNCVDRRTKLLGINKPDKVEVNWPEEARKAGVENAGEVFEELVGVIAARMGGADDRRGDAGSGAPAGSETNP